MEIDSTENLLFRKCLVSVKIVNVKLSGCICVKIDRQKPI